MREKLKQILLNFSKHKPKQQPKLVVNKNYKLAVELYSKLTSVVDVNELTKFFEDKRCFKLIKLFYNAYFKTKNNEACQIIYNKYMKFWYSFTDDYWYQPIVDFPMFLQTGYNPIYPITTKEFVDLFCRKYQSVFLEKYHFFPSRIAVNSFIKKNIAPHIGKYSEYDIKLLVELYLKAIKSGVWSGAPSIQAFWRLINTAYYLDKLIEKVFNVKSDIDPLLKRVYLVCRYFHKQKQAVSIFNHILLFVNNDVNKMFEDFFVRYKTCFNEVFLSEGFFLTKYDCFVSKQLGDFLGGD